MNITEKFHDVTIVYTDRLVQITTDQALINYLNQKGKNDARNLAKHILTRYQELAGQPLQITEDSLTVEILIHVYLDKLSVLLQKPTPILRSDLRNKLLSLSQTLKSHSEIIDCGERSVDNNRHIFDSLSPFAPIITLLLEK